MREQARRERIANNMFVWTAIAATILVCPPAIFYVLAYDIVPVIVPLAGVVMFALVYLLGIRPMRDRIRPPSHLAMGFFGPPPPGAVVAAPSPSHVLLGLGLFLTVPGALLFIGTSIVNSKSPHIGLLGPAMAAVGMILLGVALCVAGLLARGLRYDVSEE